MRDEERFKLNFGPYSDRRYRIGQLVQCQIRGEVTICAFSDGPIRWPIAKNGRGRPTHVICGGLAKAVRQESVIAVAHWWGVRPCTVVGWRRRLGIKALPAATRRMRSRQFLGQRADEIRRMAWAKAGDPLRCQKISASKRGKPLPEHVKERLRPANLGKRLSEETRLRMSEAHKRRGSRPVGINKAWESWEDELLQTLTMRKVSERTGRSIPAIQNRRRALQLPDGRTRAERQRKSG